MGNHQEGREEEPGIISKVKKDYFEKIINYSRI